MSAVYAPTCAIRASNAPEHAYCASFCSLPDAPPRLRNSFAVVLGSRAEIYECEESGDVTCVVAFEAANAGSYRESFYVCAWCATDEAASARGGDGTRAGTSGRTRRPCLALAGEGAVVRVIDCVDGRSRVDLVGHGGTVNAIAAHPTEPAIVATASKDLSVRLWHINSGVTLAIFAGSLGHRNEVLSVDLHRALDSEFRLKVLSGAMDNGVKVWATPPLAKAIRDAVTWDKPLAEFKTVVVDAPMFSSVRVHDDYVDCVAWCGDAALSRSVDGVVRMWVPDEPMGVVHAQGGQYRAVKDFPQTDAHLWWIRFAVSASRNVLACGNSKGAVSVWRLDDPDAAPVKLTSFPARRNPSTNGGMAEDFDQKGKLQVVRQCAVNADGTIVVAACDTGLIYRWDLCQKEGIARESDEGEQEEEEKEEEEEDEEEEEEEEEEEQSDRETDVAAAKDEPQRQPDSAAALPVVVCIDTT